MAQTYLAVRKRLGKVAKTFEKQAGIGLTVRVETPVSLREQAYSPNGSGGVMTGVSLTLDVIVAASDLAVAGDGIIGLR